jgi:carboxypeptidase Taq
MQNSYKKLEDKFFRIYQLQHLASIAHWDMAVMMPPGGSEARGNALAEISVMLNDMLSDKETGDLIHDVESRNDSLTAWQHANLLNKQLKSGHLMDSRNNWA